MAKMYAVPRLDVWVVCPRCAGPAHVVERGVFCTSCTWHAAGAGAGWFCHECRRQEGDLPRPVTPTPTRLSWRCPSCGQHTTTWHWLSARSRVRRTCSCGTRQVMTGVHFSGRVAEGHDALYGLPFFLRTPCAGHTLWVANRAHAEYLLDYLGADLRRRQDSGDTWGMGRRLPAWMTSRKHRQAVLRGTRRLLARADGLEHEA